MKKGFYAFLLVSILFIPAMCKAVLAFPTTPPAPGTIQNKASLTAREGGNKPDRQITDGDIPLAQRLEMKDAILAYGFSKSEFDAFCTYRVLEIGSVGDDVASLKQRMFELGYFQNTTSNRTYTTTTAERVKEYQKINGWPQTGTMTPLGQLWFYSGRAIPKKGFVYERYAYRDIARNATKFKGLRWKFTGRVVQQIDIYGSPDIEVILSLNGNVVYAHIEGFKDWEWTGKYKDVGVDRLLENDKVDIECTVIGEYTYTTINNETLTVPHVEVDDLWLYD